MAFLGITDYVLKLPLIVLVISYFPFFISLPCFLALHCDCMPSAGLTHDGLLLWYSPCQNTTSITIMLHPPVHCSHGSPPESTHDAQRYVSHCLCSNNSCNKCPLRSNSHSQSDNSEIISRNGMECQESALRITKHCYCTYYPVSSSIELPQTAC